MFDFNNGICVKIFKPNNAIEVIAEKKIANEIKIIA